MRLQSAMRSNQGIKELLNQLPYSVLINPCHDYCATAANARQTFREALLNLSAEDRKEVLTSQSDASLLNLYDNFPAQSNSKTKVAIENECAERQIDLTTGKTEHKII